MRRTPIRVAPASLLVLNLVLLPLSQSVVRSNASVLPDSSNNRSTWLAPNNLGAFVRKLVDGRTVCLEAGTEQARSIRDRDPNLPFTIIAPDSQGSGVPQTGLRIILRSTSQLLGFPVARDTFKRAAARWEALIQTRVTIIIDVDFGPTLFGKPFDDSVVGSTNAQVLSGNALYPAVRAGMISKAFEPESASLYNSLPAKAVPTDGGDSTGIAASTATLRALDLINKTADPDGELSSFGLPPAIGLNSKFSFDFDPGDGIAPDKLDFEAIALHEMGHILGFISCVGQQEMDSSLDAEPSIWDLFRVRPDGIKGGFSAAPRIQSSGGEQSFLAGDTATPLSTGRPDGTGGDGRQASHWKDDSLTGRYIGCMDPTIAPGEHHFITNNDTAVLDAMGYQANSVTQPINLIPLISGQPQTGGMVAPPPNAGALSHTQYSIAVLAGATQLRIELTGNQDVDLLARFGQRVFIQNFRPESDYVSASESGSEAITITPSSSPPLRAGTYFIAVANFGPGDADFTVTAAVTGGINSRPPAVFNIRPQLEGDVLHLDYAAIDLDGDFVKAEVNILDESGRGVGDSKSFTISSGNAPGMEAQLLISGLSAIPTALRASLILVDRDGNRSPEATIDFSRPVAGGLTVTSATFDGSRLTLRTGGLAQSLEVEINGHVVAPPRGIKVKGSGNKLIVKGDAGQLDLQRGPNRIRVKNINGWSNILIFST